jgi:hypothetical protein
MEKERMIFKSLHESIISNISIRQLESRLQLEERCGLDADVLIDATIILEIVMDGFTNKETVTLVGMLSGIQIGKKFSCLT